MISLQQALRQSMKNLTVASSQRWTSTTQRSAIGMIRPFASATPGTPLSQQPKSRKELSETFLDGTSLVYVEDMYSAWKKDPSSVHKSWASFFQSADFDAPAGEAYMSPPTLQTSAPTAAQPTAATSTTAGGSANLKQVSESMRLLLLIRAYQVRGHAMANLDPLNLMVRPEPPELNISKYGFTEADLDKPIFVGDGLISGFLTNNAPQTTLRQVLTRLKQTYCGNVGVEYMHIQDREMCDWIRENFETPQAPEYKHDEKVKILERLAWADQFESFLGLKYKTHKRFGLDGCESLIPGMKAMIDDSAEMGVRDVVIGMPHRGRLNVLANVVRKPLKAIFNEFNGGVVSLEGEYSGTGDVKYHLGTSYDRVASNGNKIHLSLVANPSHLEAVNPVVEGKVRAKQQYAGDTEQNTALAIILHGDASIAGQGVVYETLHLSKLANYSTGGTIHIVVNNQIGFTTNPSSSRSSMYCTDVAKTIDVPIFHVNGDDVEAVVRVCKLAAEWRQRFKRDVIVDIVCYRRFGHNETDQPKFTQPLMYTKIGQQTPVMEKYSKQLIDEKVLTSDQYQQMRSVIRDAYEKGFQEGMKYTPKPSDWFENRWVGVKNTTQLAEVQSTNISQPEVKALGEVLCNVPAGFELHPTLKRILKEKNEMFEKGAGFDWATAEALAFGSLLLEGNHVRLSGQDVERGTFSHRHSVLHDQNNGSTYCPLKNVSSVLKKDAAEYVVSNSSLSEFAVLGFELGYSLENPKSLILWEAQFGDFSNGAQVILDQFISSGEQKWMRQSGLVMLLPHGYDGAGPEHSSCRLERYLQLCDGDPNKIPPREEAERKQAQHSNMQVINCTTPANYFHALRRQVLRDFRKPLIMASPKWLLRLTQSFSSIDEFTKVNSFTRVYGESNPQDLVAPEKVQRLIFCSGQVYYLLKAAREAAKVKDAAIIRVEQLHPFPFDLVADQLQHYPNAKVIWCQEEPMNMGPWSFVYHYFNSTFKSVNRPFNLQYAGRPSSASPAVASHSLHKLQEEIFLSEALGTKKNI
ncbi:2-oxoglutarate dehydrogenase [Heterostelium album PN500]|uniref:2-oxoglutarate dehydrogenase, mitochondrial n=1 Tax=Heterostelium pallidum (strain ATCC 26659 / Pp 5 / PN500) TaxID=670386 RepID=D3B6X4_HETP5|nr:2-oxoglutarate dehydrogenase [Heterostelium album PN500]EFA82517.1 2-oxoglutarate dehydrogenase [Heterostelium album PN500]|eukprot:XP_020434634.1 2-oxoglutarate dehydrogenase [Heterostelium album PN500]